MDAGTAAAAVVLRSVPDGEWCFSPGREASRWTSTAMSSIGSRLIERVLQCRQVMSLWSTPPNAKDASRTACGPDASLGGGRSKVHMLRCVRLMRTWSSAAKSANSTSCASCWAFPSKSGNASHRAEMKRAGAMVLESRLRRIRWNTWSCMKAWKVKARVWTGRAGVHQIRPPFAMSLELAAHPLTRAHFAIVQQPQQNRTSSCNKEYIAVAGPSRGS
jgi:hypothetical protein